MATALELAIRARDEASQPLDKVGDAAERMGRRAQSAGGGLSHLGSEAHNSALSFAKLTSAIVAAEAIVGVAEHAWHALSNAVIGAWENLSHLAEQTHKLQIETGLSAERASGMVAVMRQFGMTGDEASRSLGIFSKNLENMDLAMEIGHVSSRNFIGALADLGVQAHDAQGTVLPMDALLDRVADRFAAMEDGVEKTGIALNLFGRSGKDMIPILNQGAEGLARMQEQLVRYGLVLDEEGVHKARNVQVGLNTLGLAFEGMGIKIAEMALPAISGFAAGALFLADHIHSDVIPALHGIFDQIAILSPEVGLWEAVLKTTANVIGETIGDDAKKSFEELTGSVGDAFSAIGNFATIVNRAIGPTSALAGAAAGLATQIARVASIGQVRPARTMGLRDATIASIGEEPGRGGLAIGPFDPEADERADAAWHRWAAGQTAAAEAGTSAARTGIQQLINDFQAAIRAGLPEFPTGGGAGGGGGFGATGRGGGKAGGGGGATKEAARSAIEGFEEAVAEALRDAQFVEDFGREGGRAATALVDAVVANTDREAARAGTAAVALIQAMRDAGVPEAEALGPILIGAYASAIIDRTPEAVEAAIQLTREVGRAMQSAEAMATYRSAGETVAKTINEATDRAFAALTTIAADANRRVSEQIATLDRQRNEAERHAGLTERHRAELEPIDKDLAEEDLKRRRLQDREDMETQHQRRIADIKRRTQDPAQRAQAIADENRAFKQQVADLDERERRENEAAERQKGRDANRKTILDRQKEESAQLEADIQDAALKRQIENIHKEAEERSRAENERLGELTTAEEAKLEVLKARWDALLDGAVEDSATILANIQAAATAGGTGGGGRPAGGGGGAGTGGGAVGAGGEAGGGKEVHVHNEIGGQEVQHLIVSTVDGSVRSGELRLVER